jgi:hypothetical protein
MAVRTPPTITTSLIRTLLSDLSWLDILLPDGKNINRDEPVSQRCRQMAPQKDREEAKIFFSGKFGYNASD